VRRYFILATKKCRIYAAFGVLQTPNKIQKGRGMPYFKKENYHLVTDEIISNVK
jgi:hypothetical protein